MIWYLVGINIITFIIYGIDKYNAVHKKYRVSEYNLFILSVLGGPIGAVIGMRTFQHKTRKILFWVFNIICLTVWAYLIIKIWESEMARLNLKNILWNENAYGRIDTGSFTLWKNRYKNSNIYVYMP